MGQFTEVIIDPKFNIQPENVSQMSHPIEVGQIPFMVRQDRKDADLSQEELAKLANTSQSTISRLEQPQQFQEIGIDTIESVFWALGKKLYLRFSWVDA